LAQQRPGVGSLRPSLSPYSLHYCLDSLNAWASCVTGLDRDSDIVRRVANCPYLRKSYNEFYNHNENFKLMANVFADLGPIFKAQDIRRHVNQWQNFNNRIDYINFYYQRAIDFKPDCSRFQCQKLNWGQLWGHVLNNE
jgi:hypothetical protein